jgi:hypothetical protein
LLGQAQALFIQHAGHTYDVITFKKGTGRTVAQVIVYYKVNSKEQWKVLKKGEPDTVVSTALENLLQTLEKEIGFKAGTFDQGKLWSIDLVANSVLIDKMKEGSSFVA